MNLDDLLVKHPYRLDSAAKRAALGGLLAETTAFHRSACPAYARIVDALGGSGGSDPADIPMLPVRLFKLRRLSSVPPEAVVRTLTSSGTTGQAVSQIVLDRDTAARQSRALVAIMQDFIGDKRLPMLMADERPTLSAGGRMNARGAGLAGLAVLGHDHHWLVGADGTTDLDALMAWRARHAGKPVLLFGFTFMVWVHLVETARAAGRRLDLGPATLIHGGGWKRLADRRVPPATFRTTLADELGIAACHDYYGMAEQVGSVFVECAHHRLHTPDFADVLIRDQETLAPLPPGRQGLIQVLSVLPRSYPGHSLLTEDLGEVIGEDDCPCGRLGRTFAVVGRLPAAELRGCSDVSQVRGVA